MSGVVGPGRELSAAEVPTLLVHGSYAERTNSIYRRGLQARRAIHLLEVGSRHGRWRADLETAVFVRAQAAAAKGTRFLLTTNDLYLAPQGIPASFVEQIVPWRSGPVPHLPITRTEALESEGQRAAARGEESRHRRNRSPTRASASSGYGVPGRDANAPTLDVGPFPALSPPEETAGPSMARSRPEKVLPTPLALQLRPPRPEQAPRHLVNSRTPRPSPPWLVPSPVRPGLRMRPSLPWRLSRGPMGHVRCSLSSNNSFRRGCRNCMKR